MQEPVTDGNANIYEAELLTRYGPPPYPEDINLNIPFDVEEYANNDSYWYFFTPQFQGKHGNSTDGLCVLRYVWPTDAVNIKNGSNSNDFIVSTFYDAFNGTIDKDCCNQSNRCDSDLECKTSYDWTDNDKCLSLGCGCESECDFELEELTPQLLSDNFISNTLGINYQNFAKQQTKDLCKPKDEVKCGVFTTTIDPGFSFNRDTSVSINYLPYFIRAIGNPKDYSMCCFENQITRNGSIDLDLEDCYGHLHVSGEKFFYSPNGEDNQIIYDQYSSFCDPTYGFSCQNPTTHECNLINMCNSYTVDQGSMNKTYVCHCNQRGNDASCEWILRKEDNGVTFRDYNISSSYRSEYDEKGNICQDMIDSDCDSKTSCQDEGCLGELVSYNSILNGNPILKRCTDSSNSGCLESSKAYDSFNDFHKFPEFRSAVPKFLVCDDMCDSGCQYPTYLTGGVASDGDHYSNNCGETIDLGGSGEALNLCYCTCMEAVASNSYAELEAIDCNHGVCLSNCEPKTLNSAIDIGGSVENPVTIVDYFYITNVDSKELTCVGD
jgi:hypothetical protein